jgi:hypothetical protein
MVHILDLRAVCTRKKLYGNWSCASLTAYAAPAVTRVPASTAGKQQALLLNASSSMMKKYWIYRVDCAVPVTMHRRANFPVEKPALGIVTSFVRLSKAGITMIKTVKKELIKNGYYKEFNKHAVLVAEGLYINNEKHGLWREYYDQNGSLMIEENYKYGVNHGRFASFHPNGKLFSEGYFNEGSREGYFKVYDEHGRNTRVLFFVGNVLVEDTDKRKPITHGIHHSAG